MTTYCGTLSHWSQYCFIVLKAKMCTFQRLARYGYIRQYIEEHFNRYLLMSSKRRQRLIAFLLQKKTIQFLHQFDIILCNLNFLWIVLCVFFDSSFPLHKDSTTSLYSISPKSRCGCPLSSERRKTILQLPRECIMALYQLPTYKNEFCVDCSLKLASHHNGWIEFRWLQIFINWLINFIDIMKYDCLAIEIRKANCIANSISWIDHITTGCYKKRYER